MIDLLNTDPRVFLEQFKTAYYEQYGETLQIGSDAFAAASVYAYCMSVFFNQTNEYTKDRFIEYATGEYLDAIAANYGINSRPDGYKATAIFNVTWINQLVTIPANGIVVKNTNGLCFTNPYSLTPNGQSVVLQAVESGTKYNNIPVGAINQIVEGDVYIAQAVNVTMSEGGTDGFPYTADGDDLYREWLKRDIQSYAGAGTYKAYEARAYNADSRVKDVYVVKQDDVGYQKGKVKIFILTDSETDTGGQVLPIVENACKDPSFRPIGDFVEVYYSGVDDVSIAVNIQVTYQMRFAGVATSHSNKVFGEYRDTLKQGIGKPFVFEELCSLLCQKGDDGVFATDAKPLNMAPGTYPTPIYPSIGNILNVSSINFSIVLSDRG